MLSPRTGSAGPMTVTFKAECGMVCAVSFSDRSVKVGKEEAKDEYEVDLASMQQIL